MFASRTQDLVVACLVVLSAMAIAAPAALANENVPGRPKEGSTVSAANAEVAKTHDRTLENPAQLSPKVRTVLGLTEGAPAFGTRNHPFTTKRASSEEGVSPVDEFPWRPTGKLFMKFGSDTFVCTAFVVRKGLLVTAAHCVHNFGGEADGFADAVTFEPARHEGEKPFGAWTATEWLVPKTYFDGTDVCTAEAPGIVCENDIAIVVVEKVDGKLIGEVTGQYDFPADGDFGYADFLSQKAAQITQLGYPSDNFDGDKMIRTDSLGYQDAPNNVIIGSNQTGGSSGGPWLQNFGVETSHTGTPPTANESNQVVGTTSWGFIADTLKVQGASRFSKNTAYTTKTNIQSLVESACQANAESC